MYYVDLVFLKISAARAKLFSIIYACVLELAFALHFICSLTFQSDIYARAYNGGTLIFGAIAEFAILSALLFGSVIAILKNNKKLFIASISLLSALFFLGRFVAIANDPFSISGVGWAVAYWVFKFLFYTILLAYFILTGLALTFDRPFFRTARAILLLSLVIGLVYYIMAIVAGASAIKNNNYAIWDLFIEPLLIVGGVLFFPSALFAMEADTSFEYGDDEEEEGEYQVIVDDEPEEEAEVEEEYEEEPEEEAVVIIDDEEEVEPEPKPVKKPAAKKGPAPVAKKPVKQAPAKKPAANKAPANKVPTKKKPASKK